ncbi:MAG: hypothetical protein Q8861_06525 [Bacteroidota bacterium]|nr:hypothetical protein [Bacteroidota bacterium]
MKKGLLLSLLAAGFGLVCLMASCSQVEELSSTSDLLVSATNDSQASSLDDDIINETDEYISALSSNGYKSSSSALKTSGVASSSITITVDKPDLVTFPKVITIDFGTSGFTGRRGNIYRGKLIITISNSLTVANAYYNIRTSNFYVNDNKVGASKTVTYKGYNDKNHPYWTMTASDTITKPDKTVFTCVSGKIRERLEINGTPLIPYDDTFSIKGYSKGMNSKGNTYSMIIDSNNPLIVGNLCPYIQKGSLTITVNGKSVVIDYGNGTCDNTATATSGGITKTFKLSN